MASILKVDKLDPQSGTALEIGSSGDTITIPSGATFTQSGTMNASAITAGTIDTARLGSGTASSSTVLYGDNTWAAAGGKLVQVQHTNYNTPVSIADLDYVSTGVTCAITPSATDSKIFGLLKLQCRGHSVTSSDSWGYSCKVTRSGGATGDIFEEGAGSEESYSTYFEHNSATSFHFAQHSSFQFLDTSHATTSAITYTAYAKCQDDGEFCGFQNGFPSQFTLMEISA